MKKYCILLTLICLCAELFASWFTEFGLITSYDYQIDNSKKSWHEKRVIKPPFFYSGPQWDVDMYTYAEVIKGEANGAFISGGFSKSFGRFDLSIPITLSVEQESITYDIAYFNYFPGYNPFTMGFGGDPVLVGAGCLDVDSSKLSIETGFRLAYNLSNKFLIQGSVMYGISYVSYRDYNLYDLAYQVVKPISEDQSQTRTTPSEDYINRLNVAIGLSYKFSSSWSVILEQHYLRVKDFKLRNEVDVNSSHDYFGISIDGMTYWQTSVGVKCNF